MALSMDLKPPDKKKGAKTLQKERDKQFEPTWAQLWHEGYTKPSGSHKVGIFQTKLTDADRQKLTAVKEAIESGEIGAEVDSLAQFNKSHALRLFQRLKESRREATIAAMIANKPANYILVQDLDTLIGVLCKLWNEELVGVDTETTGLDVFGYDQIVGLSFTLPLQDLHFYIPVRHNTKETQLNPEAVFGHLQHWFANEKAHKALFNAKFDIHMFAKEGVTVNGVAIDAMIAMHVLNENEPSYALKNLATKYGKHFGFEDASATYEELFGNGGFANVPLDIATVYACKDTHLTVKLAKWQLEHLAKQPKLMDIFELEMQVLKVVVEMERNGFTVDLDYANSYAKELNVQIAILEAQLKEMLGDINLNSPQQLQDVLFKKLGLPDKFNGSVDVKALKALKGKHPCIGMLMQYRELVKLQGTYIEPLAQLISPLDNRLHGKFNQTGTVTGRFSSDNPNLQNLPYEARKLIIAPEGRVILGADFSKIEPTILAHLSQDEKFKEPFLKGVDIYSSLASGTFHKPIEECGDGTKERKMMKTGLLATMYGTSIYTLSQQLGISEAEAEAFIQTFLASYEKVAAWIEEQHQNVDTVGYVETMKGRKRRFIGHKDVVVKFRKAHAEIVKRLGREPKNIWDENLPYMVKRAYWDIAKDYYKTSRQSVNAIIQGTGADIMKKALVNIYTLFQTWGSDYKILATIHDEVLVEVPANITIEQVEAIEDAMKDSVELFMRLKVDTEIMERWGEGVNKNGWFNRSNM